MITIVKGTFEVKLNPLKTEFELNNLGRMSIDKVFAGALIGESKGEMLTALTAMKGSAGYVAIERFSGTLEGKEGSFVLQHFGIMHNDENRLILEIVPNSGSGELEGIHGKMEIERSKEEHQYTLNYEW